MDKDIIPPRLNEKYLVWGFTVWELIISGIMLLVFLLSQKFKLLFIPALYLVSSARMIEGLNAREYIKMLFNYYCKPQRFSQIGGDDNE